jgi:hypothetical protein
MSFSNPESYSFFNELDESSIRKICDYYDDIQDYEEEDEVTPYIDLFFPFIISQEHRMSEQAIVLSGESVTHNRKKAVLKQFDLGGD